MSKSKKDSIYYGNKLEASDANSIANGLPDEIKEKRWLIIMDVIELVANAGQLSAVMPFHLRALESRKLEAIGYTVHDNTVDWDIDLFSDEDMKDAFT